MKAIIIQDHDARALLDQLKLELMPNTRVVFNPSMSDSENEEFNKRYAAWIEQHRRDCHGRFHHVVVRWLQEQGADCVR